MVRNPPPPPPKNFKGNLGSWFFGMQPYFDLTTKTASQKNGKQLLKKRKMEDHLNKKNEDEVNFKAVLLSIFNDKNLKNKWF
jgi:hypothetical protein